MDTFTNQIASSLSSDVMDWESSHGLPTIDENTYPPQNVYLDMFPSNQVAKVLSEKYYDRVIRGDVTVPRLYYKVFQQANSIWLKRLGTLVHNWTESQMACASMQSAHEDTIDDAIRSISKVTVADAAKRIGNIVGFFDTPLVPTICQYPNSAVNLPLEGRSFTTLTGDVGQQSNFFGDKVNPMDILARCKIYSRLTTIGWSSEAQGTILPPFGTIQNLKPESIPVTPSLCRIVDKGTRLDGMETPLSFFSKYYHLWRGSLKYKFEVVNSRFHQGQLYIAYIPHNPIEGGYDMPTTAITYLAARNALCASIDLSVNNCTEMIIPYVCPYDYMWTGYNSQGAQRNYWAAANKANIGGIFIYVQNPLEQPSTTAANIDINVYIAAGDDFEFKVAYPAEGYLSWTDGKFQSGEVIDATLKVPTMSSNDVVDLTEALHNASHAETASTENIMSREYIVSNFSWATTQTRGTQIVSLTLPQDFISKVEIAPYGLIRYHYLFRSDFRVRVRINPTPFHVGMLVCFWSPAEVFDATPLMD